MLTTRAGSVLCSVFTGIKVSSTSTNGSIIQNFWKTDFEVWNQIYIFFLKVKSIINSKSNLKFLNNEK